MADLTTKGPWMTQELEPGGTLMIRRGELGGWWAQIQSAPNLQGAIANFSSGADLIDWLKSILER